MPGRLALVAPRFAALPVPRRTVLARRAKDWRASRASVAAREDLPLA